MVETGKRMPSAAMLGMLAGIFGKDARWFLDENTEVVAAVGGRAQVFIDGGFSRGTDIVKAIAMGADMVGIGRLYLYGYVAAGAEGIARVIELLDLEISECLGLLGLTSFAGLDRTYLRAAEPVAVPDVHSAFPLLALTPHRY